MLTLSQVFEKTAKDSQFSHHMSNFGHIFLHEADPALVESEPPFFADIPKNFYVFAAGFAHYWCEVFLLPVPKWVFDEKYINNEPYFTHPLLKEEIKKLTPAQFAQRNYFVPAMEVMYV